jgi:glycerol uptake facilitator-like aquaporin
MGDRLSQGSNGITFLVNTAATGCAAVRLSFAFSAISGANFNPAVSFSAWLRGRMTLRELGSYVVAQLLGGFLGVAGTLAIFGHPVFRWSNPLRATLPEIAGEFLAVFGLICVTAGSARIRSGITAFALGGYLTATYWFTASTSFANPAVTIAKGLTETSSSIHPSDLSTILSAQLLGAAIAAVLFRWLLPLSRRTRTRLVMVIASADDGALARVAAEAFAATADSRRAQCIAAAPFFAESDAPRPASTSDRPERAVLPLTTELLQQADLLVTLGLAGDWSAIVEGDRMHWHVDSPSGSHEALRARVRALVRELGVDRLSGVPRPVVVS